MERLLIAAWLIAGVGCDRVFGLTMRPDAGAASDAADADAPLPPDLIAYFPLDEIGGRETPDLVTALVGTCGLAACPQAVPGVVGGALAFDGVDDAILIDASALPRDLPAFTVAAWIRDDRTGPRGGYACALAQVFGTQGANSWEMCTENDVLMGRVGGGPMYTDAPLSRGAWVHVALVWDGVDGGLFLGGAAAVVGPASPAFDGGPIVVGADRDDGSVHYYWMGAIDEVRIYRRALQEAELRALASPPGG